MVAAAGHTRARHSAAAALGRGGATRARPIVGAARRRRAEPGDARRFVGRAAGAHRPALDGRLLPDLRDRPATFGVNWLLLASIHMQETAFSTAPGTYHGLNFAHCCGGPMQFNVTNGAGRPRGSWSQLLPLRQRAPPRYDQTTAKHPSIYDDFDAIMAAAHLLSRRRRRLALDARGWRAAYDYYGHDATGVTYADQVLARAIGWSQHGFCINCGVRRSARAGGPRRLRRAGAGGARSGARRAAGATRAGTARANSRRAGTRPARPAARDGKMAASPRRPREQLAGDAVGGVGRPAEQPPRQLRAAEVQRRVVLPRRADPAVHGDHRARRLVERAAGDRARRARRERELLRPRGAPSPRSRAASARSRAGAAPRSARA